MRGRLGVTHGARPRAPFERALHKVLVLAPSSVLADQTIASFILTLHEGETGVIIITNPRSVVSFAVAVHTSHFIGALPQMKKSKWNKWKNHFSEMKGDVGMSLHEKEGEQEHAYTETGSH